MDVDTVAKINRAVDDCLDRCLTSSTPGHLTLEGFCRDLLNDSDWTQQDVAQVHTIVLRLLAQNR